jgi:hypothetical protein
VPLLLEPDPPGWVDRAQFIVEYRRSDPNAWHDIRPTYYALRGENRLYVESYDGLYYQGPPELIGLELYDTANDPAEMNSLLRFPQDARHPTFGPWLDAMRGCARDRCKRLENRIIQ